MLFWFLAGLAVCKPQFHLIQVQHFCFILFQYGETTWKKHKLSCDVSVGSVNKCFVLKSPCPVQLQELLVWPQLGGWCASSKTDRGLLGSLWLCV